MLHRLEEACGSRGVRDALLAVARLVVGLVYLKLVVLGEGIVCVGGMVGVSSCMLSVLHSAPGSPRSWRK